MNVELGTRSQELVKQYLAIDQFSNPDLQVGSSMDAATLINWLHGEIQLSDAISSKTRKKIEFLLASLRAELLKDLFITIAGADANNKHKDGAVSWFNKAQFIFLIGAGTLVASCEGFDSISTLLGVFTLPTSVVLLAGLAFSALSVVVFCGFNLTQVSKNLGVKLSDAPKLLDTYLEQMNAIKALRKKIATFNLAELNAADLMNLERTVSMLRLRFGSLIADSQQFSLAVTSWKMQLAKGFFAGISGLMFFGGGFFAGQSVAVFMLGLFMASVTSTMVPVVLFSLVVGASAFSLYWYVERVGLQKLISNWFGLDEEKIDQLCDPDIWKKDEDKLIRLYNQIKQTSVLIRAVTEVQPAFEEASLPANATAERVSVSGNPYGFHQSRIIGSNVPDQGTVEERISPCHNSCRNN